MANTRSARKQTRVNLRRRNANQSLKTRAKTAERKIRTLVASNDPKAAANLLPALQSSLDKAAKKGTIHKNKANRTKARITKLLNGTSKSKS